MYVVLTATFYAINTRSSVLLAIYLLYYTELSFKL